MKLLLRLLHQKTPRSGKDMPQYYFRALSTSIVILAIYLFLTFCLFSWNYHRIEWIPALMVVWLIGCRLSLGRVNSRVSFYAFEALIIFLCAWHTNTIGWSYGAQHLLIPMLMLCFFNIYEPRGLRYSPSSSLSPIGWRCSHILWISLVLMS